MSVERILIVGPAWVGDMVMAQSLVQALGNRHPAAAIDILAPRVTAPIARLMPGVSEVLDASLRRNRLDIMERWRLARTITRNAYDLALVLPRSWKSALIPMLAGVRRRRGYRGEFRFGLLNEVLPDLAHASARTVDKFVALADAKDVDTAPSANPPKLDVSNASAARAIAKFGIEPKGKIIVLCPGAEFGPSKQWPIPYYADLAAHLVARGETVIVLGSAKDADAGAAISGAVHGGLADLTGKTSLTEATELLAAATVVVSNDSGLMHVASALDRRVIALFGSSSSAITPPMGAGAHILERDLPCRPCFQRTCPLGHHKCLRDIAPDDVLSALSAILAE